MNLENMSIDTFVKTVTYLPFKDVIALCQSSKTTMSYCTESKYNYVWKNLIENTFSDTSNYADNLKITWDKLGMNEGTYNYSVYTNLVKTLDPVTQLRIYYKQKDWDSFNSDAFNDEQRFLAYVLVDDRDAAMDISSRVYSEIAKPFVKVLDGYRSDERDLGVMVAAFARYGSPKGVEIALNFAQPRNVDLLMRKALYNASEFGQLGVVKLVIDRGIKFDRWALFNAMRGNHWDIFKYIVEHYKNANYNDQKYMDSAVNTGNLDVIKFFQEKGNVLHPPAHLPDAAKHGHLDLVKHIVNNYDNISLRTIDEAAMLAYKNRRIDPNRYLPVVKYLDELYESMNPDE